MSAGNGLPVSWIQGSIIIQKYAIESTGSYFRDPQSKNRSLICHEYIKHIVSGSPAYFVISKLAMDGRISQLDRRANTAIARRINQLLTNKYDRTFLNVAYNSTDKTLVSHDHMDFSTEKRRTIKKALDVDVVTVLGLTT